MRKFLDEYYNFFLYTLCIVIFILSTYNIIINIRHSIYLNEEIVVVEDDYKMFRDNILQTEDTINNNNSNKLNEYFSRVLFLMKNDGVYRLMPGDKLNYLDLYNLNTYFIDTIINEGWFFYLNQIDGLNTKFNNEYVDILVNNANYLNKELLNNSNFEYTFNKNIRNKIVEEYKMILNNYQKISYLIMEISKGMVKE